MTEKIVNSETYYSITEWAIVKLKGERTSKYIQSWLHHEGLKRVKDGARFILDPERSLVPLPGVVGPLAPEVGVEQIKMKSVKVRAVAGRETLSLPILDRKTSVRLVGISSEMKREEGYIPIIEMTEYLPTILSDPPEYWEFFLGTGLKGKLILVPSNKFKTRLIEIYWNDISVQEPTFSWELNENQKQIGIPVKKYDKKSSGPIESEDPMEEKSEGFSRFEGLRYLHLENLPEDRWKIFEFPHTFLIVGSEIFFVTNLLHGIEGTLNIGAGFDPEKEY